MIRLVRANAVISAALVALALVLGGMAAMSAGDDPVPLPVLAKAKGGKCVEPAGDMRRNHMLYLMHQRDETMRKGIRSGKYSLKKCIACHAAPDPEAGGAETIRPFCDQCHAYAAVRIDCFDCHVTTPEGEGHKP